MFHLSFHPNALVFHQKSQNQGRVQQHQEIGKMFRHTIKIPYVVKESVCFNENLFGEWIKTFGGPIVCHCNWDNFTIHQTQAVTG